MALFSRLRGKMKTPQQEAMARNLLIPSIFVMTVDGSLDKSEIVQLANGCSANRWASRRRPSPA